LTAGRGDAVFESIVLKQYSASAEGEREREKEIENYCLFSTISIRSPGIGEKVRKNF
jgi:hypothetical protein